MAVATVSNTAPSNPASGALWLDTSGAEDVLRVWTGTAWTGASDSTTGADIIELSALMTAAREDTTDVEKQAIFTRLRGVGTAAVEHHAPSAPLAVKQEAIIRIASYAYAVPDAAEGTGYAAIVRNSGALNLLGPWIPRRLGIRSDATGTASTGTTPSTGGPGVDQEARDAAAAAQRTADRAETAASTNTGFLSTFMARVRAIVEAVVPAWARMPNPPTGTGGSADAQARNRLDAIEADDWVTQRRVAEAGSYRRSQWPKGI